MGWQDLILGKIDPHPMYDGIPDRDRRSPKLREAFLKQQKDTYLNQVNRPIPENLTVTQKNVAFAEQYVNYALYSLYNHKSASPSRGDSELNALTVAAFIKYLHDDIDQSSQFYQNRILPQLQSNDLLKKIVPGLFSDDFWVNVYQHRENLKLEEEAKKRKAQIDSTAVASGKAYVKSVGMGLTSPRETKEFHAENLKEAYRNIIGGYYIPSILNTIECFGYDSDGNKVLVFTVRTDSSNRLGSFNYHTDWRP